MKSLDSRYSSEIRFRARMTRMGGRVDICFSHTLLVCHSECSEYNERNQRISISTRIIPKGLYITSRESVYINTLSSSFLGLLGLGCGERTHSRNSFDGKGCFL